MAIRIFEQILQNEEMKKVIFFFLFFCGILFDIDIFYYNCNIFDDSTGSLLFRVVFVSFRLDYHKIKQPRNIFAEVLLLQKFGRITWTATVAADRFGILFKGNFWSNSLSLGAEKKIVQYFCFVHQAREMDDADIYFMNKFGFTALRQNQLELASAVFRRVTIHLDFESFAIFCFCWNWKLICVRLNYICSILQCLQLNPHHFPSFDGILRYLCSREDYFEALEWAICAHQKFPKYQRACDVILDVCDLLGDSPLVKE